MYFEDGENPKSTRSTRSKKKTTIASIFQTSQTGQLKVQKSKELVPGTVEDDDIITIPGSPSPVKKAPKLSVFARKPKEATNFDNSTTRQSRSNVLKSRQSNEAPSRETRRSSTLKKSPVKTKVPEKKKTGRTIVLDTDSDEDLNISSAAKKKEAADPFDDFDNPSFLGQSGSADVSKTTTQPSISKKAATVKGKPPVIKRAIESDSDDNFSFFEPKKSKQNDTDSEKSQQINQVTKKLSNSTISKAVPLKRSNDNSIDDLFEFSTKKSKTEEPKMRRNQKASTSSSISSKASTTKVTNTEIIASSSSANIPVDLTPGRELASTQWLSKESLKTFKTEKSFSDPGQATSSVSSVETEPKNFINVVPSTSAFNNSVEVRGKTFKKKINYKPQTVVISTKDIELHDCNLLYPKPF